MRACVIGAGAAGLCAVRHLTNLPKWEIVVYEQSGEIGGLWVYDSAQCDHTDDQCWKSSMYKNLRTNLPKELMAFPDFPFPSSLHSFVHHEDVKRYLQSYAEHFNLVQYIKFRHNVILVERQLDGVGKRWLVTVENLDTNEQVNEWFDAIFVCNGHYYKPDLPVIPNSDQFRGLQMHSCSYRTPEQFTNMRVACVGAGPSGVDIAVEITKRAEKVYLCHKGCFQCPLPPNMVQAPVIRQFTKNGIILDDNGNTPVTVDAVLYCTGYHYRLPFLSQKGSAVRTDGSRISPLYQHIVNIEEPSMYFIGICLTAIQFPCFDTQMQFVTSILSGNSKLPSRDEMEKWEREDYSHRITVLKLPHKKAHLLGDMQWDYYRNLAELGNFKLCVSPAAEKLYRLVVQSRKEDLVGYKSANYKIIDSDNFISSVESDLTFNDQYT